MKHIFAIPGGSTVASFPQPPRGMADPCPKCPEFCGEIDGRFSSAVGFSNPALLNPQTSVPLRKQMQGVKAGDIIWRNYIPWEHCTRGIACHVEEVPKDCCPDRNCCNGDPEGMVISVVTQKLDYEAYCEACDCKPENHLKGSINVVAEITDVTEHGWSKHALNQTVAPGEVLLYGFRIDALPTDESALTCAKMMVSAVVTGDSYRHPLQMD